MFDNPERAMRFKKLTNGVHAYKTNSGMIIALYEEPILPEQCAQTTEKLGDYLVSAGF